MERSRTSISGKQNILKFKNKQYPDKEYVFLHPTQQTVGCDLLIIIKGISNEKSTAIPVYKEFMIQTIDYFKREYDEKSNWRESKLIEGNILTWQVPAGIEAQSVFLYIKSLYDESVMPLLKSSCLGILQLADFWCDDFMKEEAFKFVEKNIDSDLVMGIFDNFVLHAMLGDTVRTFLKQNLQIKSNCNCCDLAEVYRFFTRTDTKISIRDKNRTISIGNVEGAIDDWESVFSGPFSESAEIKLDFQINVDPDLYSSIFVGIVDSEAFEDETFHVHATEDSDMENDEEDYQFSGFELNKLNPDECASKRTVAMDMKTITSFSGIKQTKTDALIIHKSAPIKSFVKDDTFTLIYTKKELFLKNTRGFNCSVEIEDTDTRFTEPENYRFFFTLSVNSTMEGTEITIIPPFENDCKTRKNNQTKSNDISMNVT